MQPKKILVIQNKRIGDVLISSVIANNLKKVFPKSEITYFVYDYTVGVLENNPNIDRIISVQEKELKKIGNLLKTMREIRKEKFDIIFDPYAKFQSRMMCISSRAEYRIGFKRAHKTLKLPFYTHAVDFLDTHTKNCGKAIEDRINIVSSVFPLEHPDYKPKIFLTEAEKQYDRIESLAKPVVMFTVLGSTVSKSLPADYVVQLIDFLTENYDLTVLFNYAPYQKQEAFQIYEKCANKGKINIDIYEATIRGFIMLMNKCELLIANEGGTVHITKALNKPTFTIYSPFIEKIDWNSFEDGVFHESIHLKEEKPELYKEFTREARKKIEASPEEMYSALSPKIILKKLHPFLKHHLKEAAN